ncbi:efflux RND transporter periplasmic adaptor subunit [Vibrio sp. FNV 38]|nr:efflux RND transporter periplasmic adaptor subunit [Vibrio sp. FNV 38]
MKKNAITFAITLAAAGAIFAVSSYNGSHMAQAAPKGPKPTQTVEQVVEHSVEAKQSSESLPRVSVQSTSAQQYQAQVVSYGEAKPRYELDLSIEVSGRVEQLTKDFATGYIVKQGTVLAQLDDTMYQQAVTQAKADVAAANLALLEEQRQGEQAKSEWQRSGIAGEPSSPLVLREPQLASAKANLENAEKSLESAQQDLDDTIIRAPFDALIISRDIQPGSYVAIGQSVATLYSVDQVEIELPLSEQQWNNLPKTTEFDEWKVMITDSAGTQQWDARVSRVLQHVEETTRQRSVIIAVDAPLEQQNQLHPGTFVKATLSGDMVDDLWEVPASAVSQQGEIWTVDQTGTLRKQLADKLFERKDKVYLAAAQSSDEQQVVLRPLSTFQEGMKVTTSEEG